MSLIYCYGVVDKKAEIDKKGFEEGKTCLVPFKDIFAVVSDVSEEKFSQETIDKNVKNMEWLAENGQIHEAVVDSVIEKTTIIPMKFCTIFKAKDQVEAMLEEKYADFKFNLKNLKDKVEMGIKVYFDLEPIKRNIIEGDEEIRKLGEEAEKKTKGAAYFEKQKIELLLKERARQKLAEKKKLIFDEIKVLAIDSKQNELLNKRLTKKDMLLNAVFLIKKGDIEKFKSGIEKIKSSYKDMKFEVYGAFPPYNFVK